MDKQKMRLAPSHRSKAQNPNPNSSVNLVCHPLQSSSWKVALVSWPVLCWLEPLGMQRGLHDLWFFICSTLLTFPSSQNLPAAVLDFFLPFLQSLSATLLDTRTPIRMQPWNPNSDN